MFQQYHFIFIFSFSFFFFFEPHPKITVHDDYRPKFIIQIINCLYYTKRTFFIFFFVSRVKCRIFEYTVCGSENRTVKFKQICMYNCTHGANRIPRLHILLLLQKRQQILIFNEHEVHLTLSLMYNNYRSKVKKPKFCLDLKLVHNFEAHSTGGEQKYFLINSVI